MKTLTIDQITEFVGGQIAGTRPEDATISGTCAVDKYVAGKITFIKNVKYGEVAASLNGAVILISNDLATITEDYPSNTYILVADVVSSMMDLQDHFHDIPTDVVGAVAPTANLHESVVLGRNVWIGDNVGIDKNTAIGDGVIIHANSSIGNGVTIGPNTIIHPEVTIYPSTQIGSECVLHSGVRLGVDGFRFEQNIDLGKVRKWIHAGFVSLGDRCEIGANSTVDRATFSDEATVLGDDVKLDDQVHIGHNAKVGNRSILAAQTCLSGSVKVGEDVWVGAGVTISHGVVIGDGSKVLINAVVVQDVDEGGLVSGFYAMAHRQWKRANLYLKSMK